MGLSPVETATSVKWPAELYNCISGSCAEQCAEITPVCPHRNKDNDELHNGMEIRLSLELSESKEQK